MNKKLVAVAIAGLLAAPLAQAQTANVTLYGRVNLTAEIVSGKQANGSDPNVYRMGSNSSRFGIKGTEALGGGLNAIFQVESSVNPAQAGGTLAGRDSFVGLQGGWGTFKMGRFLAPYDDIHPIFGNVPTLTTSILSTAALWAQGYAGQPQAGGFDDRLQNSLRYDTPNLSGFTASVQYGGYAPTPGASAHAGAWSTGAFYNNGPIQLGAAYEQHVSVRIAGKSDAAFSFAGGYDFGIARVGAVYERLKYETVSGDLKRNFWGVGVTANLGPGQLYAFYGDAAKGTGSAADGTRVAGLAKGDQTDSQEWTISYTYPLSKRTLTYAGYVKINNRQNASYTFNINPYTTAIGGKPEGFVLGMVHFF
ncbi:MAG: porin [Betaproteobacteria bacterium]